MTMSNQASEDELRAIIERYVDRAAVLANQDGTSFNNKHLLKLDMATAIETIIRTEKLKLLAEVRERVVGENDYQPGNPAPDLVEHNQLVRDGLRFEQRVELNKLEAEL